MTNLRSWYEDGRPRFVARLALLGASAGVASWLVTLALADRLGATRPGAPHLFLALLLGALFGSVVALGLSEWWDRHAG